MEAVHTTDDTALGINGDSQSVDSVLVIMSPALADASEQAPAQPVSNGDDNQQQAEPVNQDSTVQSKSSHSTILSESKHTSSSHSHKTHSSRSRTSESHENRPKTSEGHWDDRRKSEGHHKHHSHSGSSSSKSASGQGQNEVKDHKDQHHRSSSSSASKHSHHQSSSSSLSDPNKHRHHKSASSSSDVTKSSSSDVKTSSSSSSVDKHHSSSSSTGDKHRSSSSSTGDKHSSSTSIVDKHHRSHSSASSDVKKTLGAAVSSPVSGSGSATDQKTHSSSSEAKKTSSSGAAVSSPQKSSSSVTDNRTHSSSFSEVRKTPSSGVKPASKKPEDQHQCGSSSVSVKPEPLSPQSKSLQSSPEAKAGHSSPLKKQVVGDIVVNKIKVEVKTEPSAAAADDDDEDELPLSVRMKPQHNAVAAAAVDDDDDDKPLMQRVKKRKRDDSADDSDTPLATRVSKKVKVEDKKNKRKRPRDSDDEDDDFKVKVKPEVDSASPKKAKGKKANAEEDTSWKWWEEEKRPEGVKWTSLEHKGPVFAEAYLRLPDDVRFYYDGRHVRLSDTAEEVAGFYARMLEHEYTTRDIFNKNFMKDWRHTMTKAERELIVSLDKCNFNEIAHYYKLKSEERKNMSKEEKQAIKAANEKVMKEYGFCIIDGHQQKIGNFKIEPPGLFRGRGDHPKQGMLKKRVIPEDVIINCSKGSKVPSPPSGHKWKEVRHDNTVTWLASWTENVQGQTKYIMLNAASKLKGEKDWMKYETARKLHKRIRKIRENYREDWKSKEMKIRQRAVALYFIDKLALRAGNEKDEDQADTVGCCSLRVEHIKLHEEYDGQQFVVEFDFLGKDSIRYYNRVQVEKRVFKNLQLFMENKQDGDDLFDRLNTAILNKHLQSLMDGLTAKVFRTYNASHTLQQQLDKLASQEDEDFPTQPVAAKLLAYNRANRTVAVLCNHQRAVPKNFGQQMENLQAKIDAKKEQLHGVKKEFKAAKSDYKANKSIATKNVMAKKQKAVERVTEQLDKLLLQQTDKDENKEIALGTSKLNYLDPRITVAWCKKWSVPVEKVYNKTQRDKFAWAIDMADQDYVF